MEKTDLIEKIKTLAIDLEGLAHHRGSSFGAHIGEKQPTQAQFENDLGLAIHRNPQGFLVEDESLRIGNLVLTPEFKDRMNHSPTILLEASTEERVQRVFRSYLEEPFAQGVSLATMQASFAASLKRIRPRLGGLLYDEILASLTHAFQASEEKLTLEPHMNWIESLLLNYYDRLYRFSLKRNPRNIVFQGNFQECLAWTQKNLPHRSVSPKP